MGVISRPNPPADEVLKGWWKTRAPSRRCRKSSAATSGVAVVYGEILLPGEVKDEGLLSTYVCHPSMVNNELSGPAGSLLTYRIIFILETISSIIYMSKHLEELKATLEQVTCVGDERAYSFVPSRLGDTLADRVARHVLRHRVADYIAYSFLDRDGDERQFCAPGVDLPVASIMRSEYGIYPEYHTSADDVTPAGLKGVFEIYRESVRILENND
jgi:aminopeptidase-like protein